MGTLPDKLIELLGTGRKAHVKVGDLVPKWDGAEEYTPVEAIYRDFLGNECWITQYTREEHILNDPSKQKHKEEYVKALKMLPDILQNPDAVIHELKFRSIYYGRKVGDKLWYFVVVGLDTQKIFTIILRRNIPKRKDRFEVLYEKTS